MRHRKLDYYYFGFAKGGLPYQVIVALLFLSPLHQVTGQEGNYKFENFGNQSVLLNGNVTGSVADLGLTYYNPARLALIEKPSFTIGGKAYEWSSYNFDDLFQTDKDLSSNSFNGLPATIAGTFDLKFLPKHKFAYSIISRQRSNIDLNYNSGLIETDPLVSIADASQSFTDLSLRDRLRDEWFGVTWAHQISPGFAVGASVFGSIYEINGRGDILINVKRENNEVATYTNRLDYTQKTYGLFFKVGAAWQWSDIDMGVNLSLPFLAVIQRASFKFQESLSGVSATDDFIVVADFDDLANKRRTATGIALGAGIPWKRNKLHLNVEWYAPVGSYDRIESPPLNDNATINDNPFTEKLRSVFNFGIGTNIYVSESLNLIGSFASDFSATESGINLFDLINRTNSNVNLLDNLWHFALGADFNRPWGNIILGASYAQTSNKINSAPVIPIDGNPLGSRDVATTISYQRWRFVVGFEIPLIMDKLKKLPIPIN
jgi:hypothetical protein